MGKPVREAQADSPAAMVSRRRPPYARVSAGHLVLVVAGLMAALLTFAALRSARSRVVVAVAAQDIAPGEVVTEGLLSYAEVAADDDLLATLVPLDRVGEVDGQVAGTRIPAGELVSRSALREPAAGGADLRAMSIAVDRARAAGGDLAAGDRVDVIGAGDGQASFLAVGAEVLDVSEVDGGLGGAGASFAITVAVEPDTALRLAGANSGGGGLDVLRATGAAPVPGELGPVPGGDRGDTG